MEFGSWESLMQETPVGDNHGRKSNRLLPSTDPRHDGLMWPSEHRDLSLDWELDFYRTEAEPRSAFGRKNASEHGLIAHRGLLTKDEIKFLDTVETRARLEEMLDLGAGTLDIAYQGAGTFTAEVQKVRSTVDQKMLSSVEDGASTHWLARALGWRVRDREGHGSDCPRMRRTLTRARRARRNHGSCSN